MDNIYIREVDIDPRTRGFVKEDADGDYNIYVSIHLSDAQKFSTVRHEMEHIKKKHLTSEMPVRLIEEETKTHPG